MAPASGAALLPRVDRLLQTAGVEVTRHVCSAGPRDRPFVEEHSRPTLSVVLAGTFCYRCRDRTHALVPGSVLLGETGEPFQCSHEHGVGDLCLSIAPAEDELAAAASICAAPGRLFSAPALHPRPRVTALAGALARAVGRAGAEGEAEELALALAGEVLSELSEQSGRSRRPATAASPVDRARAVAAATWLREHAAEPLTLADAARHVELSAFHFLRVFRGVFGLTPHQFLLHARVERAAARLLDSEVPVTELAFEVGFGDLSNFVRTFHRLIGVPPGRWRQQRANSKIRQVDAKSRRYTAAHARPSESQRP